MILFLALLIMISLSIFEKKEIKKITILDECSLMMNEIINQIKNEGNCRLMCINECALRKMKFIESEFIEKINSCNECYCYCK